jgi:hypothetical protein
MDMFKMTMNEIIDSMINAFDVSTIIVDSAAEEARKQLSVYESKISSGMSLCDVLEDDSWI